MGRWTPLVLMAGGLAILMGTLLGINFPMSEGQRVSKNTQGDKASKVLPANINVNSSAPSKGKNSNSTPENRDNVTQDNFNTTENAGDTANSGDNANEERGNLSQQDRRANNPTSVAQNNATNESTPSSENTNTSENTTENTTEVQSTSSNENNPAKEPIRALW